MLTAVEPWSGFYSTDDASLGVVYATAHVTQFTKVGWNYLAVGSGSGELPGGGYYVTIVDPV
jgi:galactosylceramidase